MIIGLVGFIDSGKNTVANILAREHGYRRFAFADSLKDAVATIFMWPRGLLEGDSDASRAFREKPDPWWSAKFGYEVTPRLILQKFGTEACRNNIADNIWIASMEKRMAGYQDVVITDVRFPNEIEFVKRMGGKIIWVRRGKMPTEAEMSKMHISETAWTNQEFHCGLDNNGSIEDLKVNVKECLTRLQKDTTIFHHPV